MLLRGLEEPKSACKIMKINKIYSVFMMNIKFVSKNLQIYVNSFNGE